MTTPASKPYHSKYLEGKLVGKYLKGQMRSTIEDSLSRTKASNRIRTEMAQMLELSKNFKNKCDQGLERWLIS